MRHKMASYIPLFSVLTSCVFAMLMAKIVVAEGGSNTSSSVGINWGRQTSQKIIPSMVVDMLLANGIKKVKLFSLNDAVLSALTRSQMEVIVAISNIEIMNVDTYPKAKAWVESNVTYYRQERDVDIRYVCIGVEPFERIERKADNNTSYTEIVLPGIRNVQKAIDDDEHLKGGKVKVIVPCTSAILKSVEKPSGGDFVDEFKDKILQLLAHLKATDAPFMFNIYPYYTAVNRNLPVEFGLFDKRSDFSITDGKLTYTNIFDMEYDTLVSALQRNGYGDLKIVVGQIGWPTDGGPGANIRTAKRFYDGLFRKLASNEGTPVRPGTPLDIYIYTLADENERRLDRGQFERHYGIYRYDGKAKFNLDFTLQGRDVEPTRATGVSYLPQRWCILRPEKANEQNMNLIQNNFEKACAKGDCSRFSNGSSCGDLNFYDKVSYAFNMYFQMGNQDTVEKRACHFDGLGVITETEPQHPGCDFPILILSTLFIGGQSNAEMQFTLGVSSGERLCVTSQLQITIPMLLMLLIIYRTFKS